jgi:hypothetical protein
LGQVPILSNALSAIFGLQGLNAYYKQRRDLGWAGFIAQVKSGHFRQR